MVVWRRPVRFALAVFVVGLGLSILFGLREREELVQAVMVERTDPDAVIQTRGSRIVQTDTFGDNLRVVSERQLTYPDGGLRMTEGVEITVESRDDREGFTLKGTEASVNADQTEVEVTGDVQFMSDNGLQAETGSASYTQSDGVVRMPSAASFVRDDMTASADRADYDRTSDRLQLFGDSSVTLLSDGAPTTITSQSASIAQVDGQMTFDRSVRIDTGSRQMAADHARLSMIGETSQLQMLELHGGARLAGASAEPGALREMTASDIRLGYQEDGEGIDQATLDGDAQLELFGTDGRQGTTIHGRAMDVVFTEDGADVETLSAREDVVLNVPQQGTQPAQQVTAAALQATSGVSGTLEHARFEGSVEYRESHDDTTGEPSVRVARAQRLDTTLADGLSSLDGATFYGDVTFEDSAMQGKGDQAHYVLTENRVELTMVGPEGQVPRVVDRRGSVQAETVELGFQGPRIDASGRVESVLSQSSDTDPEDSVKRPGLFEGNDPVLVTAAQLSYDGETETATYDGEAHLWQGDTDFRGDTIVLDETAGNLAIDGAARTRFRVTQINDDTGLPEEALTTGRGGSMHYADELRQITYTAGARLTGPRADLTAELIEVYLHPDNNALDRIIASGDVTLVMTGRLVSGATLVYYDADGRYEMEGEPVRIVEEGKDDCRETTGRTLTFFITADEVSVDGQEEARTETVTGDCSKLMRR